jgi:hypothetical protein
MFTITPANTRIGMNGGMLLQREHPESPSQ